VQELDVAVELAKVFECNTTRTLSGSGFLQQFGECGPLINTDSFIEESWTNLTCPKAAGQCC